MATVGTTCLQQDTISLSDWNHIIFAHKGQSDIDEGNNEFNNIFKHGQSCFKPNSLATARLAQTVISSNCILARDFDAYRICECDMNDIIKINGFHTSKVISKFLLGFFFCWQNEIWMLFVDNSVLRRDRTFK